MKKYRKSRTEENRTEQSRAERFNMHMAVGLFVTATSKNKNNRSLAFALTHTMISSDVLSSLLFSFLLFLFYFFYFGRDLSYFAAARCSLVKIESYSSGSGSRSSSKRALKVWMFEREEKRVKLALACSGPLGDSLWYCTRCRTGHLSG